MPVRMPAVVSIKLKYKHELKLSPIESRSKVKKTVVASVAFSLKKIIAMT